MNANSSRILLYAPISFTALFCYIVKQRYGSGLKHLERFIDSITGVHQTSPALTKMLLLFQTLYNLAKQLTDSSTAPEAEDLSRELFEEVDFVESMIWMDDLIDLRDWVHYDRS